MPHSNHENEKKFISKEKETNKKLFEYSMKRIPISLNGVFEIIVIRKKLWCAAQKYIPYSHLT